ncbi:MAG: Lrp/AsnC family transcriptional regulator [Lutispora sp.]|nr:Lrp/AsnC family transcriptional regulator [Lutispora sp.]
MDNMDLKILMELEKNGRITHEELSKILNISRPAIHQRVCKLEQSGIIRGYKAHIDWCKAGQVLNALIFINAKTLDFNFLMKNIMDIRVEGLTIEECYRITGQWCLMIKIRAHSTENITALHDEILKVEGATETLTMLILSKLDRILESKEK